MLPPVEGAAPSRPAPVGKRRMNYQALLENPGSGNPLPPSLHLLSRQLHHLAPALGLGGEHGAEFFGVAGDRNGAEFAEPLLDRGIGKSCVDFLVQEIDDLPRRVVRSADVPPNAGKQFC